MKRRLDVVDFGSGALAMEVGLALAVLNAQAQGLTVPEINAILVEPSDAMTRIGLDIWESFLTATDHEVSVDMGVAVRRGAFG